MGEAISTKLFCCNYGECYSLVGAMTPPPPLPMESMITIIPQ